MKTFVNALEFIQECHKIGPEVHSKTRVNGKWVEVEGLGRIKAHKIDDWLVEDKRMRDEWFTINYDANYKPLPDYDKLFEGKTVQTLGCCGECDSNQIVPHPEDPNKCLCQVCMKETQLKYQIKVD